MPRYDRANRFLAIRRQAGRPCSNFREASSSQYRGAEGEGKMNDPKKGFGQSWTGQCHPPTLGVAGHQGKPTEASPVDPNDLRTLIDMGYVEMKNDQPVVMSAGLDEMEIGD